MICLVPPSAAWSADTTWTPDAYAGRHPSTGQCASTAVVLCELFLGAQLMRGWVAEPGCRPVRHYWADLTWAQFPPGSALFAAQPTTVAEVVSNPWMEARVDALRRLVLP